MPSPIQIAARNLVIPAAQATMAKYGVPASITLAQWELESSYGASQLAVQARNYFGIKFHHLDAPDTYVEFNTDEYVQGKKVLLPALFQKYKTDEECFADHAALLAKAARYKPAMAVRTNPALFALGLQTGGYSTAPDYAEKLMTQVRQQNLTQYDLKA